MEENKTQLPPTPDVTPIPEPIQPLIQPPTQPIPIPEPPDNKMSQKLLIPSIVLLIVAVILVSIKLILQNKPTMTPEPTPTASVQPPSSPTPDPIANWKTYINNQYNYSLKIPQDWVINAEEKSPAQSKIDPSQRISKIKFNNKASSVEIFYEGDWDHGFEPWVFEKKETINLGGKDANHTILGLEGKSPKWHIISIESFNNFRIEANIDPGDSKTFDQILSTFKFKTPENDKESSCIKEGAEWLAQFNECESPTLPESFCQKQGGRFYECESPCRHDPKIGFCMQSCMAVCKFN